MIKKNDYPPLLLGSILFTLQEQVIPSASSDTTSSSTNSDDTNKDIAGALKSTIEPLQTKVDQVSKDINVIQKSQDMPKQTPTNAMSTTGATQPTATTPSKTLGTITPPSPSSSSSGGDTLTPDLGKKIEDIDTKITKLSSDDTGQKKTGNTPVKPVTESLLEILFPSE